MPHSNDNKTDTNRDDMVDLDVEVALLAQTASDMGEITETLDISTLSEQEKRLLIALMRQRLGMSELPATKTELPKTELLPEMS